MVLAVPYIFAYAFVALTLPLVSEGVLLHVLVIGWVNEPVTYVHVHDVPGSLLNDPSIFSVNIIDPVADRTS